MREFDAFAGSAKIDSVFANDISGTDGVQPDLVPGALTNETLASMASRLFVLDGPRLRDDFTKPLRCSAW